MRLVNMIIFAIFILETYSAFAAEQNNRQNVTIEFGKRDGNRRFRWKVPQCTTSDGVKHRLGSECESKGMASVVGLVAEYGLIYCQGAILNPYWVLSNAVCYKSRILVIAGRRKLYREDPYCLILLREFDTFRKLKA